MKASQFAKLLQDHISKHGDFDINMHSYGGLERVLVGEEIPIGTEIRISIEIKLPDGLGGETP